METVAIVFTFFGLTFLFILIAIWIVFNYLTKTKLSGKLSKEEEQTLEDIWKLSNHLEDRIESLEVILESEVKGGKNDK